LLNTNTCLWDKCDLLSSDPHIRVISERSCDRRE